MPKVTTALAPIGVLLLCCILQYVKCPLTNNLQPVCSCICGPCSHAGTETYLEKAIMR